MAHRILVVEDHVESAEGLVELLRLWGHEAHVTHDGPTGLAQAWALQPTAALLDLGLPGIDGCTLARRLRDEGMTSLLLIALTGSDSPDDHDRIAAAGFDHRLVKPVDLTMLERLLARPPDR